MTNKKPLSILLVKTSAIGDVIQTFSVLDYLRQRFPQARIDWVVEKGILPLLEAHPQISSGIAMDSKAWRKAPFSFETRYAFKSFVAKLRQTHYDVLFDLQGNTKSAVVTRSANAKVKVGFDWQGVREKTNLLVTNKRFPVPSKTNIRLKYLRLVQQFFKDDSEFTLQGVRLQLQESELRRLKDQCAHPIFSRTLRLMVCFGSKWSNKRLDTSTLIAFLKKIEAKYDSSFVFIFGDAEEKRVAEELVNAFSQRSVLLGNLSLPLWQAFMWEMDGVIAVDSAALHLCGTTQTPSFSIFGPSLDTCYKPIGNQHGSIQGPCPYQRVFFPRCPVLRTCATGACIRHLSVEEIFSAFENWRARLHDANPCNLNLQSHQL